MKVNFLCGLEIMEVLAKSAQTALQGFFGFGFAFDWLHQTYRLSASHLLCCVCS